MATTTNQKVMVAIDESEQSKKALEYYVDFLHKPGNVVIVAHCIEMPYIPERESIASRPDIVTKVLGESRAKAKKMEQSYVDLLKAKGVEGSVVISDFDKNPGHFLCETATKEKVGLLVLGTRGLGTIRRTIMGSVSDYVVHHAHCPVTVCRD